MIYKQKVKANVEQLARSSKTKLLRSNIETNRMIIIESQNNVTLTCGNFSNNTSARKVLLRKLKVKIKFEVPTSFCF